MQATARRDPIFRAIEAMTALAEIFERRREVLARDAGITIEQWRVLEEISTAPFHSVHVREEPRQLGRRGLENTCANCLIPDWFPPR